LAIFTYILKRLVSFIPVFLGVTILTFFLSHVIPGDPINLALGPRATKEQRIAFREKMGMDKPIIIQYAIYLNNIVHRDLGVSIRTKGSVSEDLFAYFPATLELTIGAMLICIFFGIYTGVISAARQNRPIDHGVRIFSLIGVSMPIFYGVFNILPGGGRLSPSVPTPTSITGLYLLDSLLTGNWSAFKDSLWHLTLPTLTLGFCYIAYISRMMRSSMLEVLRQNYIRTARTKGFSEKNVIKHHALRNSLIPVATEGGMLFAQLMCGTILTEMTFSWPGIGLYAMESIMYLDYNAIMGFVIVVSFIYVVVNLAVDILYVFIDPRIKLYQ
jgi:peptide/nickel transport system permease protein